MKSATRMQSCRCRGRTESDGLDDAAHAAAANPARDPAAVDVPLYDLLDAILNFDEQFT